MSSRSSLSWRLALPFLAFVAVGSTALVAWLQFEETRESRSAFVATARANVQFVRSQRLPATERTAQALGEVLGMEAYFWRGGDALSAVPDPARRLATPEGGALAEAMLLPAGAVRAMRGGEGVRIPIDEQVSLLLFRVEPAIGGFWRFRTFAILCAFWALSLALAWALASGIVRPLRALAQRLPRIADENAEPLPEAARTDEIGQLARAYEQTHAQLAAERRARGQAERLATLGRMATGLAHEINNPVAAIKLHAQLLETGTTNIHPPPSGGLDSLSIILAENAKIEALVNQWMFLARPQPPALANCDPADLIANALRVQAPAAEHARVRVVNEMHPGFRIEADARRLGQAIGNVIINAIQAMSASGGTLRIMGNDKSRMTDDETGNPVGGETPSVIRHSSFVIRFIDTGPGFSAAALARHAELFFSEKEGGMGIGLNVTAEILRAHGGELRVANSADGGATVTFSLPIVTAANSELRTRKS
jgi:signal transduction histidine kinase